MDITDALYIRPLKSSERHVIYQGRYLPSKYHSNYTTHVEVRRTVVSNTERSLHMIEFDPGPPPEFAQLFAQAPDYGPFKQHFWYDWGPVFYRGRLDGSSRLLCIASDPGPTERVALRTLVGDAGQRVQGFMTKLGLTRSYICLNAFIYALFPSHAANAPQILSDPIQKNWRNELYTKAKGPNVQAIIAF